MPAVRVMISRSKVEPDPAGIWLNQKGMSASIG